MTPEWSRIWEIAKPILMLVLGGFVTSFLERRPRLVRYVVHPSAVVIQPPNGQRTQVHVHALVVKNNGRKPANNVRLGHNTLPDFSVHPNIQYRVEDLPGGGKEIIFPVLVAGADVLVQYLYFPPLIWKGVNTHLFSDEGRAKAINVWQVRQFSKWV